MRIFWTVTWSCIQIHPYDAAIVAAARELEAPVLYSEDLNHGQVYAGVQLVNPFRDLARRRES